MYIVDNSLDMSNYRDPIKKFLRNVWSPHTPQIPKTIYVELSDIILTTFDSLIFHSAGKSEEFHSLTKQHETIGTGNDCFFLLNVQLGHDREVYTREYQKISTALGKVFGVLNVVMIIGHLVIYPYCRLAFFLEGIRLVINNSESELLKRKKNVIDEDLGAGLKLSLVKAWKLLLSPKKHSDPHLDGYFQVFKNSLEIKSIFYHFLEFKKLLLVVFDRDQQTLFHCLPRYISRNTDKEINKRRVASFLNLEEYDLKDELNAESFNSKALRATIQKSFRNLKRVKEKDNFTLRILDFMACFEIPAFAFTAELEATHSSVYIADVMMRSLEIKDEYLNPGRVDEVNVDDSQNLPQINKGILVKRVKYWDSSSEREAVFKD